MMHNAANLLTIATTAGQASGAAYAPVFGLILVISVVLLTLLLIALVLILVRYRRRAGVEAASTATGSPRLQAAGIGIAVILMIIVFVAGIRGFADLITAPALAYDVYVVAGDSAWTFEHRNGKIQDDGQLFVPADRPVRLIMSSRDVTYSAFLPHFRIKQDIVPGRETKLWFEAAPGEYRLIGSEYSGEKFAQMKALVTAYPADEFGAALDTIAYWLDAYTNAGLYKAGYRLYVNCVSCHSLDGSKLIGPSFRETHSMWGQPRVMEDGREVVIDDEYARRSILAPQTDIVAGYTEELMTNFTGQLRDREVIALIEFIRRLNEVVDESGNPLPGIETADE
ncbi:MAG: hypothetical protein JSV91_04430 [Phycisphaerales bacterium]|nr:MAG: hypothetical protein JSV91_04430 [Phycisphaerales bacterium]